MLPWCGGTKALLLLIWPNVQGKSGTSKLKKRSDITSQVMLASSKNQDILFIYLYGQ